MKRIVLLLIGISSFSLSANAELYILDTDAPSPYHQTKPHFKRMDGPMLGVPTHVGEALIKPETKVKPVSKLEISAVNIKKQVKHTHKIIGFANNESLRQLFAQIAPKDWTFDCSLQDCDKPFIKWKSTAPVDWMKVMKPAVKLFKNKFPVHVVIDDHKQNISVSRPDNYSKAWILKGNKSLKQNVTKWAKDAGYKVVWSTDNDWSVGITQSIHGTFSHALSEIVTAYRHDGVNLDISINDGLKLVEVKTGSSMYQLGGN